MLRAGVATVPLDPPVGIPMLGYGARMHVSEGTHDPLHARALYLEGSSALLLVEADLCLLAPAQADALRGRIAARTGLERQQILLGCIHTHSGPEPGFAAWLGGVPPPEHALAILSRIEEAALRAHAAASPARIGVARAEAQIGRNRRRADGPVDPTLWVVRIDGSERTPRALLVLHGCHPTVLGHENLAYSADWPGATRRALEARFPGCLALFALSAHGDVDPRTRGLHDLAAEGQSRGAGFDAMEALGVEVAEAAAAAAERIRTDADAPVMALSERVAIPVHGFEHGEAEHARHLERARREALAALELPADHPAGTGELFGLLRERTRGLPVEEARERIARARLYLRDRTAPRFAGGPRPEVEVQLLRLGPLFLLALPAEPTVDVGLDWRWRLGGVPTAVVSIANGWLRYLPHPRNFEEPNADRSYEVLMSTLVPDAAERLLRVGEGLYQRAGL